MYRQSCPICNCQQIIPLLEHFRISAQIGEDSLDVQGLWGFVCQAQGHIFFVRISDVKNAKRVGETTMKSATSSQNWPKPKNQSGQPSSQLQEEIRKRAYELYEQRGSFDGHDIDDWLQAESEIPMRKRARVA
jgi:hypothetical protein